MIIFKKKKCNKIKISSSKMRILVLSLVSRISLTSSQTWLLGRKNGCLFVQSRSENTILFLFALLRGSKG